MKFFELCHRGISCDYQGIEILNARDRAFEVLLDSTRASNLSAMISISGPIKTVKEEASF